MFDLGLREDGTHDHRGIFIPPGVAHGFSSLTDMTITYLVDGYYNQADELGVAWDDPAIGGDWGVSEPILSKRDQSNPRLEEIPERLQPHWPLRT
jgi:dTDP-4-dehydrorhamnose 3,5-epimerase